MVFWLRLPLLSEAMKWIAGICLGAVSAGLHLAAAEVAIVVHKDNPVSELSMKELVSLFEQRQQFWKSGQKVHLVLLESARPEKRVVLREVYHKGDEELKRYWLMMVFKGELAGIPLTLGSNEEVKRYVRQEPNAIGFIAYFTVPT